MSTDTSATTASRTGIQAEDGAALSDLVYRDVLREIIEGVLRPGAWLKERELSERFEVSRIPVRQALQRLEAEGFVTFAPRRGASVAPFSAKDIEDLFDLRLCFEPFAARRAAERVAAGQENTDRLRELADEASVDDQARAREASLQFHAEIVRMSGNSGLMRMLAPLLGRLEWMFRVTRDEREDEQNLEHRQIVQAISEGRAELSAALTYAHIDVSRTPVLASLAEAAEAAETAETAEG